MRLGAGGGSHGSRGSVNKPAPAQRHVMPCWIGADTLEGSETAPLGPRVRNRSVVEACIRGGEVTVDRRTFVIEAGKAFPIVAGALYVIGCGSSSPTSPLAVADVLSTSTVVNAHSHTVNVPASDQMHPVDMTYTAANVAS